MVIPPWVKLGKAAAEQVSAHIASADARYNKAIVNTMIQDNGRRNA